MARVFEISDALHFDHESKRAYDIFVSHGSRIFAIANNKSMSLWVATIPQIAVRVSAVRHAITAIGAVQLRAMQGDQFPVNLDCHGDPTVPEITVYHRSRALHELYKSNAAELPIEAAVSCAMFFMVLVSGLPTQSLFPETKKVRS